LNGVAKQKFGPSRKGKEKLHDNQIASRKRATPREKAQWKNPPRGWVKVNTDASCQQEDGMASTGEARAALWKWLRAL
jgi:hypothetical protein